MTGNSDKNIAEFMGHCEYLRSKEFKKLGYLAHFHRRDLLSVTFGVFSFFRGPLEGVVGVLAVRSPVPGRGVVWESVEPGVEKITKIENFRFFSKVPKSPKMHSNEVFMCF